MNYVVSMHFTSGFCLNFFRCGYRLLANNTRSTPTRGYHALQQQCSSALPVSGFITSNSTTTGTGGPVSKAATTPGKIQQLLSPFSALLTQVSGFKVKGRLKRRCKDCYFVVRHERHYVICPTHPRHKQMSMKQRDYKTWILTHATQSKIRPF